MKIMCFEQKLQKQLLNGPCGATFWSTILMLFLTLFKQDPYTAASPRSCPQCSQWVWLILKLKVKILSQAICVAFRSWQWKHMYLNNRDSICFFRQVDAPRERGCMTGLIENVCSLCCSPLCCREGCPATFLAMIPYCWYADERRPDPEWLACL